MTDELHDEPRRTRRELREAEREAGRRVRQESDAAAAAAGIAARERLRTSVEPARPVFASPASPRVPTRRSVTQGPVAPPRQVSGSESTAVLPLQHKPTGGNPPAVRRATPPAGFSSRELYARPATPPASPRPSLDQTVVSPPTPGRGLSQPAARAIETSAVRPFTPPAGARVRPSVAAAVAAPPVSPPSPTPAAGAPSAARVKPVTMPSPVPSAPGQPAATAPETPADDANVPSRRSMRDRSGKREVDEPTEVSRQRRKVVSMPRASAIRTVDESGQLTGILPVTAAVTQESDVVGGVGLAEEAGQAPVPPSGALQKLAGSAVGSVASDINDAAAALAAEVAADVEEPSFEALISGAETVISASPLFETAGPSAGPGTSLPMAPNVPATPAAVTPAASGSQAAVPPPPAAAAEGGVTRVSAWKRQAGAGQADSPVDAVDALISKTDPPKSLTGDVPSWTSATGVPVTAAKTADPETQSFADIIAAPVEKSTEAPAMQEAMRASAGQLGNAPAPPARRSRSWLLWLVLLTLSIAIGFGIWYAWANFFNESSAAVHSVMDWSSGGS
ncbi:hypothetical protein [Buchananella hordeovulneris]|uniref:Uncharacterized protein n=1 Tax=Buchananella hordeovulneris TaxID=52770 RepID=A0A1Q5PTN8_9ACTO|nr:hypothetical protein [Buchananella hordeovulneris]OKL50938.1 hypothetical protein BSZ40_09895 [Buchananella hordeovulneris]